jgi:hypothetical protein
MITPLEIINWHQPLSPDTCNNAIDHLENGQILLFDQLSFSLSADEKKFLTPYCIEKGRKNISYDLHTDVIKGVNTHIAQASSALKMMMHRYAAQTQALLSRLLPTYETAWQMGRTSFRPIEIMSRTPLSKLKDDRLLHVDAFPTTPVTGKRILRFFTNINPHQLPRRWRKGESFADVSARFLPKLPRPWPLSRRAKQWLKLTRGYQTLYDHYMVHLHDAMKLDDAYQEKFTGTIDFPAGASWLVFTDSVSHAATAGQFVLEQTFYLPVTAMKFPERSPHHILEKKLQRRLV